MKNQILLLISITFLFGNLSAQQLDLTAEVRPRYENKHGYKSLISKDSDGSNFISQRTRLNVKYKKDKLRFGLSLQNVRVWGDVSTLSSDDKSSSFHEAWAEALLSDQVSLKLGRQEIVYDDHRIFGSVGWAQQARSHDAFLFKYKPEDNHKLDIGIALNADNQGGLDALYSNAAGYKNFQYVWYHGDFNKVGLSALILNTGVEYLGNDGSQKINSMQTMGPRLTYKSGNFNANAATYIQSGKLVDTKVSSSYYTVNMGYKVSDEFSLGVGWEYLSGKDNNSSEAKIKSFAPLFGTNHKFNGWMDYFYVGNHGGSVGLNDINGTLAYKKNNFSAKLIPHIFSAAADVYNGQGEKMDNSLGTEVDLTLSVKIASDIDLSAGYSLMFATETMEVLKGGDKDATNSWGWIMFTFKPKLFSYKAE